MCMDFVNHKEGGMVVSIRFTHSPLQCTVIELRILNSYQKFKIKIKKSRTYCGTIAYPNGTTLMQI
jgi:hypothetical protein